MLVKSQSRALARLVAVLGLTGLCAGSATAQSTSPLRLAALTPAEQALQEAPAPTGRAPFGLRVAPGGALSTKWRSLQPALHLEAQVLDLCRSEPKTCSPGTSRFLAIIEAARTRSGRARIGEVNRAVNLAIRPVSDVAQFHVPDVWTTPLMTFALGTGDCEDYAIAKYVALREAGMDAADLRIIIMHDQAVHQDHAVTAVRIDGSWLILDNRHMVLLAESQLGKMIPLLVFDSEDGNTLDDADETT
jgi:predicted transglutaminase-like cysteine proteinase